MKAPLGLAVVFLITASLGIADEPVSSVAFVLGPKHFSDGNAIGIEQVAATSQNFAVGDKVTVRGRYTFTSEEKAQLRLTETLKHPGHLHLSFYGSGGKCLGTVYFGTEQQMKEISHWNVRTY